MISFILFLDKAEMIGKQIQIKETPKIIDESSFDLYCRIEGNGVKIRGFRKTIIFGIVSSDMNQPKPQEQEDLRVSPENIRKGQISLGLYNRQMSFMKSNYEVRICI